MAQRPAAWRTRSVAVMIVALVVVVAACDVSNDATEAPLLTGEPPTDRLPTIVDTDLDLSDIAALAILLRDPRIDLQAVTIAPTGTGVTNCGSGRRLLQYVLEEFDATTIPFACGRDDPGPDGRSFPAEARGDADAAWGMSIPPRAASGLTDDAVTLLSSAIDESPSAPTLVALGPWTNLEDVLTADPTIGDRIAAIHAMGGAVDVPGNVVVDDLTPADGLEWNFASDPSAVSAVFGTATPISLVPLDATDDVPVPADLVERLAEDHEAAGADIVYELLLREPTKTTGEGQQLWDELTALTLSAPDLVTWDDATLLADDAGRINRDEAGRPVRIATNAAAAVEVALLDALRRGPARATPFELGGAITVRWDGSACALDAPTALTAGVVVMTFENETGDPAGVQLVGVREPRAWADVLELLSALDADTGVLPDWVVNVGTASDDAGTGQPASSSATLEAATTYGPVCVSGDLSDLTFRAGDPFTVAPAT